jgi:hypothetical protein
MDLVSVFCRQKILDKIWRVGAVEHFYMMWSGNNLIKSVINILITPPKRRTEGQFP